MCLQRYSTSPLQNFQYSLVLAMIVLMSIDSPSILPTQQVLVISSISFTWGKSSRTIDLGKVGDQGVKSIMHRSSMNFTIFRVFTGIFSDSSWRNFITRRDTSFKNNLFEWSWTFHGTRYSNTLITLINKITSKNL